MTGGLGNSLGITTEDFIRYYPRLYHMAEPGTWPSISLHGLLSTSALLDLYEIAGEQRREIESCHRPESIEIRHEMYGVATIRDQKPMSEKALQKCLVGTTPAEWYEILNSKVFLWVTPERVNGLLGARAYRGREHTVLTLDSRMVLERYPRKVTLSPINSGSTIYRPQPRGGGTFRSLEEYPFENRRKMRGISNAIAELAVAGQIRNIRDLVVRVEHRNGSRVLSVLFPK